MGFYFFCPFLSTLINSIHVNHVFNGLTHTNRCGATWSCFQCRLPPKLPLALRFHFINLSTLFERVRDFIHLRCLCVWLLAGNWLISWLIFECKYWSSTCLSFNSIIRYYISLFWGWGLPCDSGFESCLLTISWLLSKNYYLLYWIILMNNFHGG